MDSKVLFLTLWLGIMDTSKGLTSVNFTLVRKIQSMKYTSLSVPPLNILSQIECSLQCEEPQCCSASYNQKLQECYLHSWCFGDVENTTGWNILKKDIVLRTIYINQKKSWDDSQAHCASLGGRLAVVDTAKKHELIRSWNDGTNSAWVGASDKDEEGAWVWHNPKQPVLLDYWYEDRPNNYGGTQHCMAYYSPSGFIWEDRDCSELYNFICDIPENV